MTYYLQRDYDGQNEDYYHLCDEPFEYPATHVHEQVKPSAIVLHQNYPNPFNPFTSIEYSIPRAGNTRLEIFNVEGQLVDVLVDGLYNAGIAHGGLEHGKSLIRYIFLPAPVRVVL